MDETVLPDTSHYQTASIEPIQYIIAHDMDYYSANITKYVSRWPYKGQAKSDIKKIIHYAQMLLADEATIEKRCKR
ncbi:MAG: DUF3310 domain-containing protein [Halieaceae bacterium]|nr:DUF3310 domain-containing protein [Halieaceae bacterium]